MSSWLRARPRTLASIGVVSAAAVTIGALAFAYDGKPTTEVDLNDGGVWTTKQSSLLVGHYNSESKLLDGGLRTTSDTYDVLQSGGQVLVHDQQSSELTVVDPARVVLSESAKLPAGSAASLGAGTVAILDPAGSLFVVPFGAVAGFDPAQTEPVADLGKGARAVVGTDGTVYAVSPANGTLTSYGRSDADVVVETSSRGLDGLEATHEVQLTAVGSAGYALDADTGKLYGSDGFTAEVPGQATVQQPSAAADTLTLATATALVRVPLGGGDNVTVDAGGAEGTAAAPVFVAGCAYGAWSGSGRYVRDCAGETDDVIDDVPGIEPTSVLQFRTNRDVVVLNDVFGGAMWLPSESMQRVDNWMDITPPEGQGEEEEETTEETVQTTLPDRSAQNTPPLAEDDEFGIRAGRTTVLTVLDNDTDADGDVLVASATSEPSFGVVEPIHNGGALQLTVPADATGSTTFTYQVDDGRGGTAEARVTVTVHGDDVNSPPVPKRTTPITVETGGTASYNVLPDWIDPDGDDIFLKSVVADGGDEADYTSDGQITYRAIGGVQGRKDVPVVVSDGTDDGAGIARYDIRPLGTTLPITNADHVVTRVGKSVSVSPLTNDTSSGSEQLRLTRVDEVEGATITPAYSDKTFTFTSDIVDTYYVQYLVSAGPNSVPGIVRVDVLPESETDLPPVAVRDVALLPSGGDVLVNVLANDTDPAGGILVVQSVTVGDAGGVAAAVLGHETIRITDQGTLDQQVRVSYTISNGAQSASGDIVVIPVPAPSRLRPPVANDDQVVVRAGDIVTIPVLDNDYHPNGDTMHVAEDLVPPLIDEADGEAFVAQDMLRFRAGEEPKTVYATYEAVDSTGQRDAGYVTIQILPRNDEANAAPRPHDLTARTLSGATVRVAVPLDGIDEDGDSVELIGLASAPGKGRIAETGVDYFDYIAFDDSVGSDTFTYRVKDRLGKEATATVQIGIAPPGEINQAPYAVRDSIIMRPDRQVALSVQANDSDPDGDQFGFAPDALDIPDVDGLAAETSGKQIVITSPPVAMQTSLQYTIADARGLTSTTNVQITVDPEVPLVAPIAADDRVRAEDVTEAGTADVAVLENDEDADGTRAALTVTLGTGGEAATVREGGIVRVTLGDAPQLITYTVRDRDGLTSSAFVHVPALSALPPSLLSTTAVEVKSGESIDLPLSEYVRAAGGKSVVITEAAKVSAVHSNGGALFKDQTTLTYTSADRYFGPDALTFEVTDGTGPDDPNGRKATLTIPITVLPPDNVPPAMVGAEISVAPDEPATTLDLAGLATDPDPGTELDFALVGGAPDGLSASVSGSTLSVSSDADTQKGTRATLTVSVTDGESEPVTAPITVTVTASIRPLPTANDDIIAEADQGDRVDVPVLDNDVNPFPDTPLKVVFAGLEAGEGAVDFTDGRVSVTSPDDFVGVIVVRYRVQDKTLDTDRQVDGRIRITVQGRPDAPGKPTVSSVQSRTVVLSWTPPIDNGKPITGYTVSDAARGFEQECRATTCTLTGLTNNVEYNFTVTATNAVGTSDPSVPSETARPDVRPDTPAPPTLKFQDRALDVSWTVPRTEGSPVETYTLEISPAPPSGVVQKTGIPGTTVRWDGLENGTSYTVRVRAHNRAPEPSEFSPWSQAMVPAAPPSAPAAPTTQRIDSVGSQAQLQVSWGAPAPNGDAIAGYELRVMQGSTVVNTVPVAAGQTSQAVTVSTSTSDYTFTVRAQNKAGWGQWSPASAPRRAFTPPGAPTAVGATEGNNTVGVTWRAGALNGANASEVRYEYSVNTGGWRSDWVSGGNNGSGTIGNGQVNNNGAYTIRVRAVATADGSTYYSDPSAASNQVRPYGQIGNPTARASASGTTINYSWTSPGPNGRTVTTQIRINGGGWETVGASGSRSANVGHSYTGTIEVRASADGSSTTTASASARTADPPPPRAWLSKSGSQWPGCVNGCPYFVVNVENFPAGNYQINCYRNGGKFNTYPSRYDVPSSGRVQLQCWLGQDGHDAFARIEGWGDTEHVNPW
ncbi:Ig-like domain-containing protein [Microbacterium telephonicum]|nr:Ig-like domain-containing protein [Microbacterium telephonicum]